MTNMTNNNSSYYNAKGQPMTPEAFYALRAANLYYTTGRWAAARFAFNHGVSLALYRRARQLVAMDRAEAKMMARAKGTQAESLPVFLRQQAI